MEDGLPRVFCPVVFMIVDLKISVRQFFHMYANFVFIQFSVGIHFSICKMSFSC